MSCLKKIFRTVVWRPLCSWGLQFASSASRWHSRLSFALPIRKSLMAKGRLCQVLSVDHVAPCTEAWRFTKSLHTYTEGPLVALRATQRERERRQKCRKLTLLTLECPPARVQMKSYSHHPMGSVIGHEGRVSETSVHGLSPDWMDGGSRPGQVGGCRLAE